MLRFLHAADFHLDSPFAALPARQAVPMAVWLHGEAGEVGARAIGEYGMTPTDVIAALPAVIEEHVS